MYYSASAASSNAHHCVGAATSGSITGPYTPGANPLYCPLDQGGAIDASWFVDTGGQRYVLYKVDGMLQTIIPSHLGCQLTQKQGTLLAMAAPVGTQWLLSLLRQS